MEDEHSILLSSDQVEFAKSWLKKYLEPIEEINWYQHRNSFRLWCEEQEILSPIAHRTYVWDETLKEMREERKMMVIGIHTWEEIDSFKFPENPWRMKNLLPLEGNVVVAGVSGDGKTFVSLDMAKAIATPCHFLNNPMFEVVGGNVLYIDGEMSKSELQRRGRQLGFGEKRQHKLLFVSQDDVNLQSEEREDLNAVMKLVQKEDIKVIFVDTLRAVAGGMEENKAEEVRKFFNRFKSLKDMGVCVVFLDHLRKGYGPRQTEPQKDNLLASIDKVASAEILLMLQKKPSEPIITVHQRKNRLGPEIPSFDIRMYDTDIDSSRNRTVLEFVGMHDSIESVIEKAKVSALEALQDGDMTRQELIEHVKKSSGISKRSVHVALKALSESKLVGVEKVGRQHKYSTNTGGTGDVENKSLDF